MNHCFFLLRLTHTNVARFAFGFPNSAAPSGVLPRPRALARPNPIAQALKRASRPYLSPIVSVPVQPGLPRTNIRPTVPRQTRHPLLLGFRLLFANHRSRACSTNLVLHETSSPLGSDSVCKPQISHALYESRFTRDVLSFWVPTLFANHRSRARFTNLVVCKL